MIRTATGFLALLALLPALPARDKPDTPTPAQQYQSLVKEYQRALTEFNHRRGVAKAIPKTQGYKQKEAPKEDPQPEKKFAPRFLELAEKNPKDPAAVDALAWVIKYVHILNTDPKNPRNQAVKILLRDHVLSEKMADVCWLISTSDPLNRDSQQLLRTALEKNKHRPAQARACYALALDAERRMCIAWKLKDLPEMVKQNTAKIKYTPIVGKEVAEELVSADPEKVRKEAESLYNRVVKEFSDLADVRIHKPGEVALALSGARGHKLGEVAKEMLDSLPHLIAIGKPAPDIEGEDIGGVRFKLGNYRGKVVMLDFWGHSCIPCRVMYPYKRSLMKRLEGKPFALIGVNHDTDRTALKKVIDEERITWRSFWTNGQPPSFIARRWEVESLPTLFLIDANGVIRHKHHYHFFHPPHEKALDEEIDKLIAEIEKAARSRR